MLKKIRDMGAWPCFNPRVCHFIDNLNYSLGFNFQHALNGGEVEVVGYSLDGYDKEKNIVFEYDEPWHHNPCKREKYMERKQNIISKLDPFMFIIYDEKHHRLYDSLTNIDLSTSPSIFV